MARGRISPQERREPVMGEAPPAGGPAGTSAVAAAKPAGPARAKFALQARRLPRDQAETGGDMGAGKAGSGASARKDKSDGGAGAGKDPRQPGGGRKGEGRRGAVRRGKARRRPPLVRALYWLTVATLWAGIAGGGVFVWVLMHMPPIHELAIPKRPPTVKILALDGSQLAARGEMGGAAVPLRDMPVHLQQAFIAIEDRRFYAHYGVDVVGLARAAFANVARRGIAQGGSTITQQLAKNLFLKPARTLTRKLEEVVLALWLEHKFSKREILELYLNRIYFGSGAYGVEAAAQRYFNKSARQVTLPEAALLAGLVKSPSRLTPIRNYEGAEKRAQLVLAAMAEAGFVSENAARLALVHPPRVAKPGGGGADYAADWVMDVLDDVIGRVEDDLVVETTFDSAMQAAAEKAVVETLAQRGEKFGVEQAALVAMTPDGAVRALVGGRDYQDSPFNRAVTAKRQPGSAFKPFVFLTAIERGLTPDTVREDRPIVVKNWKPENHKNEYHGPATLAQALALSLNSVSVRLTLEFGPTAVVRTAHRLGIASKLERNAAIALGASEVSLLELTGAYAPFANGGFLAIPHAVARVRNAAGKVVYARAPDARNRMIEPAYVGMMNQMMRETVRIGTGRGAQLPGWPVAGKTGTSQDYRDAWFVGFTGRLVAGAWFGNDDGTSGKKLTGGTLPVEAWTRFMTAALAGAAVADLPGPAATPASAFAPALRASGGGQAGGPQDDVSAGAPLSLTPPASIAGGTGFPPRAGSGGYNSQPGGGTAFAPLQRGRALASQPGRAPGSTSPRGVPGYAPPDGVRFAPPADIPVGSTSGGAGGARFMRQ